jgi:hypothetical protein
VKPVFLLVYCGCIFHGTGNSVRLCRNFGISEEGGFETPLSTPLFVTADYNVATNVTIKYICRRLIDSEAYFGEILLAVKCGF